ncbi:hypothetical protein [Marinobacter sp. ANT_B65]|nr:hypothetical protein [Marinobacter sp. ANT_B65]
MRNIPTFGVIQPFANYDLAVLIGAMNTAHCFRLIDTVGATFMVVLPAPV